MTPPGPPARIVLVGFMGSGKSAVGKRLAKRLGYRLEDMDQRIEAKEGCAVAEIFRTRGEAAFRELELAQARALRGVPGVVIASGGGAFAQPRTRALLQEGALTVWLRCPLATVLRRVRLDGSRPLAGNREIMRALLAEREPSYRLADVTVDTSGLTPREVADRIVRLSLGQERGKSSRRP